MVSQDHFSSSVYTQRQPRQKTKRTLSPLNFLKNINLRVACH